MQYAVVAVDVLDQALEHEDYLRPTAHVRVDGHRENAVGTKRKCNIPADKQALYDKLLAASPKIERKGAANPYTSLNGHMFTYLNPSGTLALRLPEEERKQFLKKYKTTLFKAYGSVMKEYVTVPDSLLRDTKTLRNYLDLSYAYIKTLKANPGKKKS